MKLSAHTFLLYLFSFLTIPSNAQQWIMATSSSSDFDSFLFDATQYIYLMERKIPNTGVSIGSFLYNPNSSVNPVPLGAHLSQLKIESDENSNVFIAGIYNSMLMGDTCLFLTKTNKFNNFIWTINFPKNGDTVTLFQLHQHWYLYDQQFLYKINTDGDSIWYKSFNDRVFPGKEVLYNVFGLNLSFSYPLYWPYYDTLAFNKIDTGGVIIEESFLIESVEENSQILADYMTSFISDKILISGKFWGKVDMDPSSDTVIFTNYAMEIDPHFSIPIPRNFFAVYDTNGNFIWAKDGIIPTIKYLCEDSSRSVYMAGPFPVGPAYSSNDFILNSDETFIVHPSENDRSYIAKYTGDLELIWIRKLTGYIKNLEVSNNTNEQTLFLAGHYNGSINLNLAYPNTVTFSSDSYEVFVSSYHQLDSNLSILNVQHKEIPESIRIHPNPSNGIFILTVPQLFNEFSVRIYFLNGNQVFINSYPVNTKSIKINLTGYPSGLYLIKISDGKAVFTQKIFKI